MGAIETGHVHTELAREWRPSDVVVTFGRSIKVDFTACVSGSVNLHALPELRGHTVWVFVDPSSQLTPVLQHYVRCKQPEVSSTSALNANAKLKKIKTRLDGVYTLPHWEGEDQYGTGCKIPCCIPYYLEVAGRS